MVTPDNPSAATPAPRKTLFDAVRACLTDTLDEPCRIHACGNKPRFANPDDAHPTIMPCCPELGTDFVRIRPAAYWFSGRAEVDEVDVEHRAAYHVGVFA